MPDDLKPCPFCGHEADGSEDFVCCSNYKCAAAGIVAYPDEWNRRHPDRAALIEVARRALFAYLPTNLNGADINGADVIVDAERIVSEYLTAKKLLDIAEAK